MKPSVAALLLAVSSGAALQAGTVIATPEPGTMMLVGGGIAATILVVRSRRKK